MGVVGPMPPRQAEVHHDRLAADVDHDVRRLEVAMDDAAFVRLRQRERQQMDQLGRLTRGQR